MASFRLDVPLTLRMIMMMICTVTSTEKCTKPLPALMQMASGVDIAAFDLFPIGNSNESSGLLESVFNFTCSGVKIGHKLTGRNKEDGDVFSDYDLPDQITDISVFSKGEVKVGLMSHWASVKEILLARYVLKTEDYPFEPTFAEDGIGAFSRSSKYTSLLKQHFDSNKVFYDVGKTKSSELVSEIQAFEPQYIKQVKEWILSHDFIEFITRKLPPKYEDNPSAYEEFIARFGTHYFRRVYISDYDYAQFALNQNYLLDTDDEKIDFELSPVFDDYFNATSKNISNSSEIVLAYSALKNGTSRWVDKLTGTQYTSKQFTGLSIRRALLGPIKDLIDNQTIRSQVDIAVQMHRIRAQLEELKNVHKFTSDYYQLSSEKKVALENVTKLVNSRDIKQLDQMVTIVSELYNKANWVRDKLFLSPVIDDLYLIASTKLEFAKQICPLSARKCPASHIREGVNKTSELCEAYHNCEPRYDDVSRDCYKKALELTRWFNQLYGLRADITRGLTASCADC